MNLLYRNHCVVNNKNDLELLYSINNFPVFMGCVTHPPEDDIKTNMNWYISKSTGSIQLNPLIPLDILYKDSHDSGSVGNMWNLHHEAFSKFINKFSVTNVLEIGAGHGKLATNYLNLQPNTKWTIVEPNPKIKSTKQIKVIKTFFNSNFKIDNNIDAVVHSHILEHIYEPNEFIRNISNAIKIGAWHFFSVPNMKEMLKRKYTNCINFEHTIFITEQFIEYWLKKNNFKIKEKLYFLEDGSIFYATIKSDSQEHTKIISEYETNKLIYTEYIQFHTNLISTLNNMINNFNGKIYLFGGHIFSQYLIASGLNIDNIECIIDNDPNKQEKRLYGTPLIVQSPKILANKSNIAVILRTGIFNNEIKNDIINNTNPNVTFWE